MLTMPNWKWTECEIYESSLTYKEYFSKSEAHSYHSSEVIRDQNSSWGKCTKWASFSNPLTHKLPYTLVIKRTPLLSALYLAHTLFMVLAHTAIMNLTSGESAVGKTKDKKQLISTLNIGVAAATELERDHERSLPCPNICGCGHIHKCRSFILSFPLTVISACVLNQILQ